MPRIKVARKSTVTDMTAMCDVAFLLLTFFILTATSRQADPLEVKTPSSTVKFKVKDKDLAILTLGKGKVFYEIIGMDVKQRTLQHMGETYGIKFTDAELKRFGVIPSFGVTIGALKQYIAMDGEQRKKSGLDIGIPTADTTANGELSRWIYWSQVAVKDLHNVKMEISIKGDAQEEYPTVKKIVNILQKQNINKFSLITTPEADVK